MELKLRLATMSDVPELQKLISASVRGLSSAFYTSAQIDSALANVFGVDTQLIDDQTYYVIDSAGATAAAGGWSGRRTLFGGDQMKQADNPRAEDPRLDPHTEAARIRAFFVHPDWARRGLARELYNECERAACSAGFQEFELMATLPGIPLYERLGFVAVEQVALPMIDGITLPLVRMRRLIGAA